MKEISLQIGRETIHQVMPASLISFAVIRPELIPADPPLERQHNGVENTQNTLLK